MKSKSGYKKADGSISSLFGNVDNIQLTPQQAIRHFCWECMGGHENDWVMLDGKTERATRPYPEVRDCPSHTCWLHPFRTGRNPYSKRTGNPHLLEKARESKDQA